jgi:hypothetical protein
MDEDDFDGMAAGKRVSNMWRELAEQISGAIPDIVSGDNDPGRAIRWAACAEAAFWKATGEAETHDVVDVICEDFWTPRPSAKPTEAA